jgi:hypothetical protein
LLWDQMKSPRRSQCTRQGTPTKSAPAERNFQANCHIFSVVFLLPPLKNKQNIEKAYKAGELF